ncbi:MAG: TetR/AcrR family transcriptional repressor of nem operon [Cryomorphaceae bacterium]|jgi:TetR/AcrR family transcriptional repressor of nem operon
MARPSEFIRIKALEAATKLFWVKGYTASSLPELLETMNIARSSFYATFGSKRSLFVECLELLGDRTRAIVDDAAQKLPASGIARAFFETTLLEVAPHVRERGCLLVNSTLELAGVDPELNRLATRKLNEVENCFARAFMLTVSRGELDTVYVPEELARLVMTINIGLRVQSRQNLSAQELKPTIENSLTMLGLAA